MALAVAAREVGGFDLSGPAVTYGSMVMVVLSFLLSLGRALPKGELRGDFGTRCGLVVSALVDGAKNALSVALACASAGIIIGIIALTGIGIDFTQPRELYSPRCVLKGAINIRPLDRPPVAFMRCFGQTL